MTFGSLQDKKDGKLAAGSDNALFRCEFLEALVRIAVAKCGRPPAPAPPAPPAQALDTLLAQFVEPSLPALARSGANGFREARLYNEECDEVLKAWEPLLAALYSRWRLRPPGGGLRSKVCSLACLPACPVFLLHA